MDLRTKPNIIAIINPILISIRRVKTLGYSGSCLGHFKAQKSFFLIEFLRV
jgi:hypothetical protein